MDGCVVLVQQSGVSLFKHGTHGTGCFSLRKEENPFHIVNRRIFVFVPFFVAFYS